MLLLARGKPGFLFVASDFDARAEQPEKRQYRRCEHQTALVVSWSLSMEMHGMQLTVIKKKKTCATLSVTLNAIKMFRLNCPFWKCIYAMCL